MTHTRDAFTTLKVPLQSQSIARETTKISSLFGSVYNRQQKVKEGRRMMMEPTGQAGKVIVIEN